MDNIDGLKQIDQLPKEEQQKLVLNKVSACIQNVDSETVKENFNDKGLNDNFADDLKKCFLIDGKLDRDNYGKTIFLQSALKIKGLYEGNIDGSWCEDTENGIQQLFTKEERDELNISGEGLLKKTYIDGKKCNVDSTNKTENITKPETKNNVNIKKDTTINDSKVDTINTNINNKQPSLKENNLENDNKAFNINESFNDFSENTESLLENIDYLDDKIAHYNSNGTRYDPLGYYREKALDRKEIVLDDCFMKISTLVFDAVNNSKELQILIGGDKVNGINFYKYHINFDFPGTIEGTIEEKTKLLEFFSKNTSIESLLANREKTKEIFSLYRKLNLQTIVSNNPNLFTQKMTLENGETKEIENINNGVLFINDLINHTNETQFDEDKDVDRDIKIAIIRTLDGINDRLIPTDDKAFKKELNQILIDISKDILSDSLRTRMTLGGSILNTIKINQFEREGNTFNSEYLVAKLGSYYDIPNMGLNIPVIGLKYGKETLQNAINIYDANKDYEIDKTGGLEDKELQELIQAAEFKGIVDGSSDFIVSLAEFILTPHISIPNLAENMQSFKETAEYDIIMKELGKTISEPSKLAYYTTYISTMIAIVIFWPEKMGVGAMGVNLIKSKISDLGITSSRILGLVNAPKRVESTVKPIFSIDAMSPKNMVKSTAIEDVAIVKKDALGPIDNAYTMMNKGAKDINNIHKKFQKLERISKNTKQVDSAVGDDVIFAATKRD